MEISTQFNPVTRKLETLATTPDPLSPDGLGKVVTKIGETAPFIVLEGPKGEKGDKGDAGKDGVDGKNGLDGKDGRDGVDGKDGLSIVGLAGKDGRDGVDGKDGEPGQSVLLTDKAPLKEIGKDGDWVFNKLQEIFHKENGEWKFYAQIANGLSRGMVKSLIAESGGSGSTLTVSGTGAAPVSVTATITSPGGRDNKIYVEGNGGDVTVTTIPNGTYDGERLRIHARNNLKRVLIDSLANVTTNGAWNGGSDWTLDLDYDLSRTMWVEAGRSEKYID
jgi:Collagen triple helix repeat (20 copies)